ncbi:MAG: hypothetical protein JSR36_03365 [Proteobacteria bacterium]|nr:hypothetical protein [Pseudomonadota bacterium]
MRPRSILPFCIIWLVAVPALAARTTVIDDSGTLPHDASLNMRWKQPSPRGPDANTMVGTLDLRVKLNVAPWQKRTGKIYLALPAQAPGPLAVSWTTQGRLLPGRVVSGNRALVYSGPITTPFIEDMVQLTISVDGRRMQQLYRIDFRFEMDED